MCDPAQRLDASSLPAGGSEAVTTWLCWVMIVSQYYLSKLCCSQAVALPHFRPNYAGVLVRHLLATLATRRAGAVLMRAESYCPVRAVLVCILAAPQKKSQLPCNEAALRCGSPCTCSTPRRLACQGTMLLPGRDLNSKTLQLFKRLKGYSNSPGCDVACLSTYQLSCDAWHVYSRSWHGSR